MYLPKQFLACAAFPALFLASLSTIAGTCKPILASLNEIRSTQGCDPGLVDCFLGEVKGSFGFRGTTHFKADGAAAGPATGTPGFISYSGPFQYRLQGGLLNMRETGVTNTSTGLPQSGYVTAYQLILGGTGRYEGATGYLFVSGRNVNNIVDTIVHGEICLAR